MEKWLITGANQLLTLQGAGRPKTGKEMNDLGIIEDGAVAVEKDTIIAVGTRKEVESEARKRWGSWEKVNHMDATGKVIMPGLIDPHTHLVYAGSREDELNMRLNGKTYLEILEAGGGILSTTQRTRAAGIDELVEQAKARLDRFLKNGVTTVEAKSGYGLSPEHELKQLRVTKRLNEEHPVEVVSTFMGAHAVPKEYQKQPDAYVRLITDEMIPRVVSERLAEFCDVFCERGVFSVEQSETILRAAKAAGLIPKIHADELEPTGGAELAARIGAISADHLLKVSDEGIRALAKAKVVAVLLPGTAFFLMAPFADGRKMIDAGVPVALSTDCNPGSSPTESLLLMMNLACFHMKMTPAEVITAVTVNAAHAIGRADRIGSLEPGKQADLVVFDVPNYLHLTYHYGSNDVERVMKKGKWVV
ncbi:imidazolonepropionase [Thermoactinomyces intermedius]|jgi:imidazolonepropionase|uniref:Imidazolonepropionase n=1 Tax=Thermoactinomyces intermedius TaxID=2024 RepID=A0A8I1ADE3_THEIN|nr:imidazolonepropionase [Thermoactinomyces intermedius]MBA4548455.1 imidazolonepropionase [Thermoactinomyces intermedius]MBA4837544.1 imidazolonepropionase [Thermoactinomyces intermedius]MBH8595299.1 imidazolonepropionase [Thermoactinomyces intermedius]